MNFSRQLQIKVDQTSTVVVGIDPDIAQMSRLFLASKISELDSSTISYGFDRLDMNTLVMIYEKYSLAIIEAIKGLVPAIKIQIAFFERMGYRGIRLVEKLIQIAKNNDLLVIMDVKRGDIPSTAEQYAQTYLHPSSPLAADAVTLHPYLGVESLLPFIELAEKYEKGVFVCLKTSNEGSKDIQDLLMKDGEPLYLHLARQFLPLERRLAEQQGDLSSFGVVVGATYPREAQKIREVLKNSFFLVPGLGHQGGKLEDAGVYYSNPKKKAGVVFNYSRSVIYPEIDSSKYDSVDELTLQSLIKTTLTKLLQ